MQYQRCQNQTVFQDTVSKYNRYCDSLAVLDGVPMYGKCILVPRVLSKMKLENLHSTHQCPVRMLDRAKESVFWTGIMLDIGETRKSCLFCKRNAPSQPIMLPIPLASPEYPFQMIVAYYFNVKGQSWLVIADRFSGLFGVHYYPREASSTVIIKV